jgi:predicted glycogen debranching enzyme
MPLVLGTQLCGRLDESSTREWLLTDGLGGYAMGTVAGLRTRRYHALLVVAGGTVAQRHVALAALDPVLELRSGATVRLGTHEWFGGAVSPTGYQLLERFDLTDGVPRWRWRIGDVVLERELAMRHGEATLGVVHRLLSGGPVRLRLEALCTWRDAHGNRDAGGPPPATESTVDGVLVEGAYRLAGPGWQPAGEWYRGAWLREEVERGLPPSEDLWLAGQFAADLAAGDAVEVTARAGDAAALADSAGTPPAREIVRAARERGAALAAGAVDEPDAVLRRAADAFIVGGTQPDVVAGYPWFGAWSRDTMIAYPGLFLATGRADEGRELLRRYAGTLCDGTLANTCDTGTVEYNTVDGTLWFVHAIDAHVRASGDTDLAAELLPALMSIRDAHTAGLTALAGSAVARYRIGVDPADGLLSAGVPGEALTWMDARVNGVGVTPRIGKPVEVNALWVNALRVIAGVRERVGADPSPVLAQADAATVAFRRRYTAPGGWLYDVVDGPDGDDDALRPNQLLAYALPHGPLRGEQPPAAIDALLTPLGLRTLAPGDPAYLGRHRGSPVGRDSAYHQGTAWPWLIGPYRDAHAAAGATAKVDLEGLVAHLNDYGLGSVSETADGDPPHGATGCPFQAWSVAELLRARQR